jgi:hypothetical protein
MRLPKPKSLLGLLLYGVGAIALIMFGKVMWSLVDYTIQQIATTAGLDHFIAKGWPAAWAWVVHNIYWTALVAALFGGAAAGAWLTYFLTIREHGALSPIDRIALAGRADELAQKISALAGEYTAAKNIAWNDKSSDVNTHREQTTKIDARFIEKFGERHYKDVLEIVDLSSRLVQLDSGLVWRGKHLMHASNIDDIAQLMTHIAVSLRHPKPMFSASDEQRLKNHIKTLEEQSARLTAIISAPEKSPEAH